MFHQITAAVLNAASCLKICETEMVRVSRAQNGNSKRLFTVLMCSVQALSLNVDHRR